MFDPKPQFGDAVTGWAAYFAWRPVWTWDGRFRWLTFVQRRRILLHSYLSGPQPDQWWQYRLRSRNRPVVTVQDAKDQAYPFIARADTDL